MARQPSGRPEGRPRKDEALIKAALALVEEGMTPEAAAEKLTAEGRKIGFRTIYRAVKRAHEAAPAAAAEKPPSASPVDLHAFARRVLRARDPSALFEYEAAIVEAGKGEAALVAFLARPLPTPEDDDAIDPLDACSRALSVATNHLERVPPLHARAASLSTAVANLAARVEKINAGRPREVTADEVTSRINGIRDDAVTKITQYVGEARTKFAADRASFIEWGAQNLGPLIAAEMTRRLDAMHGETS